MWVGKVKHARTHLPHSRPLSKTLNPPPSAPPGAKDGSILLHTEDKTIQTFPEYPFFFCFKPTDIQTTGPPFSTCHLFVACSSPVEGVLRPRHCCIFYMQSSTEVNEHSLQSSSARHGGGLGRTRPHLRPMPFHFLHYIYKHVFIKHQKTVKNTFL